MRRMREYMSIKTTVKSWDPLFWPVFIAAFLSPWAGGLFERWLPYGVAGGIGMFAAWVVVGIALSVKPPIPNWSLLKWIAASAIGAVVGGGVMFLLDK